MPGSPSFLARMWRGELKAEAEPAAPADCLLLLDTDAEKHSDTSSQTASMWEVVHSTPGDEGVIPAPTAGSIIPGARKDGPSKMLFFAKVLRTASEDEVKALFSQCGTVEDINLFRAFKGSPTNKGCGLLMMSSCEEVQAAIEAFDGKHTWEGMDCPMVVKQMDATLQRRRRDEAKVAGSPAAAGVCNTMTAEAALLSFQQAHHVGGGVAAAGAPMVQPLSAPLPSVVPVVLPLMMRNDDAGRAYEQPPAGCAADAIKLFVGNIAKVYSEEHLHPVFAVCGTIVELVIQRDRFTHESKGSAFIWYQTREQAETAISRYNLSRVLPDPTGEQSRALVVRRANARKAPTAEVKAALAAQMAAAAAAERSAALQQLHMASLGMGVGAMAMGGEPEVPVHLQPLMEQQMAAALACDAPLSDLMHAQSVSSMSSLVNGSGGFAAGGVGDCLSGAGFGEGGARAGAERPRLFMNPFNPFNGNNFVASAMGGLDGLTARVAADAAVVNSGASAAAAAAPVWHSAQHMKPPPAPQQQAPASGSMLLPSAMMSGMGAAPKLAAAAPPGAAAAGGAGAVSVTLTLRLPEMLMLTDHIFTIQTVTGVRLQAEPIAPGLFNVSLQGSMDKVQVAQLMLASCLQTGIEA